MFLCYNSNLFLCWKFNKVKMELDCFCVVILSYLSVVNSISWNLQPNTQKCVKEKFIGNGPVIAEFDVSEAPGQTVDCVTTDSKGQILIKRENISKGSFSFDFENSGTYEICFISHSPSDQRGITQEVSLVTRYGVEVEKYDSYGEVTKLKSIMKRMKQLEDLTNAILQDLAVIKKEEERKEKEAEKINELTDSKLLRFFALTGFCLLILPAWQVLYIRSYFRQKKLSG